jgi:DNA-binding transcriptional LysR family regulator
MELRHFRCFSAVAEQLHFTRAADQIGISTPAMSKAIRELEDELGVRLFHRTKRAVNVTSAGQLFAVEVERAMTQFERAIETAKRGGRGDVGRIELGYVASAAFSGVLQKQLAAYRRANPGVQVTPREVSMSRMPLMLEEGTLDISFVRPPMNYPAGIDAVTLLREDYVVAIPESSKWSRQPSIRPSELSEMGFVMPEQQEGTMEVARRGKFTPRIAAEPGGLVAVMAAVSVGQGVAIVPHSVIDHVRIPGVTYRPVTGKPVSSEIAVAYRRHEQAPAVRAFIEQIKAASARLDAAGR